MKSHLVLSIASLTAVAMAIVFWSIRSEDVLGADPMQPGERSAASPGFTDSRGLEAEPGVAKLRGPVERQDEMVGGKISSLESGHEPIVDDEKKRSRQLNQLLEARYFGLSMEELQEASSRLSQEMGVSHSLRVQEQISRGLGEVVSFEDWSFGGDEDPDVMMGGHTDGTNYYKVPVHRHDDPALFLLRDELRWVNVAVMRKASEGTR